MTRDIGLPVMEPKKKPIKNENNNPFNGSLTIRGKLFEGIVINAKAKGTAVIQKESMVHFKKFKRFGRSKNTIHAHIPSNLNVQKGDYVVAAECRPISKSVPLLLLRPNHNVTRKKSWKSFQGS
jgi:small subunit ribosomal protein S17